MSNGSFGELRDCHCHYLHCNTRGSETQTGAALLEILGVHWQATVLQSSIYALVSALKKREATA
jgi:hypothetical protein